MWSLTTLAAMLIRSVMRSTVASTHCHAAGLDRFARRHTGTACISRIAFNTALRQEDRSEQKKDGEEVSEEHATRPRRMNDDFDGTLDAL